MAIKYEDGAGGQTAEQVAINLIPEGAMTNIPSYNTPYVPTPSDIGYATPVAQPVKPVVNPGVVAAAANAQAASPENQLPTINPQPTAEGIAATAANAQNASPENQLPAYSPYDLTKPSATAKVVPTTTKTKPTSGGGSVSTATVTPTITPTVTASGGTGLTGSTTPTEPSQSSLMMKDLMAQQSALTNPYMDTLQNTKFEYDTASDPDYQREAANLENQVAQMMIGRGGLYSSVTASALQSRLSQLQGTMRQQKYNEYVADRDFNMNMAKLTYDKQNNDFEKSMKLISYQTDREDTAFNQNFQLSQLELTKQKEAFDQQFQLMQYKASREDEAYNRSLQQQQLSIQKANAEASRQAATGSAATAAQRATLNTMAAKYNVEKDNYAKYQAEWASSGYPSAAVQAFFGVDGTTTFWSSKAQSAITNKTASIAAIKANTVALAEQTQQADMLMASINDFTSGDSPEQVAKTTMTTNYNQAKYTLMNDINSSEDALTAYNNLMNNKEYFISYMGGDNYEKLLSDIKTIRSAYQYSMDEY